ncbi:MAG: dimethyl sulfoxide reductase anchor subunit [Acidobacteriota bacterium]
MPSLRSSEPRRAGEPAFVFDPDRCTGCEACRIACGIENGSGLESTSDTGWREVLTFNPSRHPALPTEHLSLACNHCEHPACMLGCPAAAYHRDEATGAVLLDPDKCMGCHYCSWVCPYDAPRYDAASGTMSKCTFCNHRLEQGLEPACIDACPTTALRLGTRADAAEEPVGPGLEAWGLGPALAVRSPRRPASARPAAPASGAESDPESGSVGAIPPLQPAPPPKIRPGAEWALVLFTVAIPALLAWLGAGLGRPDREPTAWAFLAVGGAAMGLSTLHLGRPLRAWRAVLNLRTSPLSREIALTSAFLGVGTVHLLLPAGSPWRLAAGVLAVLCGAGALVAIDAVYRAIPRNASAGGSGGRDPARIHGADAWLTGALLAGLALQVPMAWVPAALLKVLLGLRERTLPAPFLALRLLLLAAALLLTASGTPWPWAFAAALPGELLDRAGFYRRLDPATPARTMAARMTAATGR